MEIRHEQSRRELSDCTSTTQRMTTSLTEGSSFFLNSGGLIMAMYLKVYLNSSEMHFAEHLELIQLNLSVY